VTAVTAKTQTAVCFAVHPSSPPSDRHDSDAGVGQILQISSTKSTVFEDHHQKACLASTTSFQHRLSARSPFRPRSSPISLMSSSTSSSKKRFPCPRPGCQSGYRSRQLLNEHIRATHEGQRIPCGYPACDKTFANRANRNKHVRNHLRCLFFQCSSCEYENTRGDNMKRHIESAHDIPKAKQRKGGHYRQVRNKTSS